MPSSPAMASQHPPLGQELDLDAFLPSSPTSSTASDADTDHRRAVDDLLLLLSSSDSDSEESTPVPSTSSRTPARVRAPALPPQPSPPQSPSPSASASPRRSTSASPSDTLSSLVSRTFSGNGASSSKPLPSLFRGVRPSPKPGAALAAAAAASRAVFTPHAAAIMSRRSVSAPVDKLLEEGSGSEASEELLYPGGLEAEVEEKGNVKVVAEAAEQTTVESGVGELEEEKHDEVGTGENSEPTNLLEASTVDPVVKEDFSGLEETTEDGNLAETDEVEDQNGVANEENEDNYIADDDHLESVHDADPIGVVSKDSFDNDQEAERSDSSMEELVESESIIDKVIEERMEQLEINRKAEKNSEKKRKASMKPLEWAEELEKRQASFGQHWEEGAAAQPIQLEGIGKGPPAIGYMQIEMDNAVTRAMASPSFRTDHGSPQVLAVHRSYVSMGTSKGAVIIIPSKYSIHQADDTDTKARRLGRQLLPCALTSKGIFF